MSEFKSMMNIVTHKDRILTFAKELPEESAAHFTDLMMDQYSDAPTEGCKAIVVAILRDYLQKNEPGIESIKRILKEVDRS